MLPTAGVASQIGNAEMRSEITTMRDLRIMAIVGLVHEASQLRLTTALQKDD